MAKACAWHHCAEQASKIRIIRARRLNTRTKSQSFSNTAKDGRSERRRSWQSTSPAHQLHIQVVTTAFDDLRLAI